MKSRNQIAKAPRVGAVNKCNKCGYEWPQRTTGTPKQCPNCKSYKWNESPRRSKA